jgi:hypothetical protein
MSSEQTSSAQTATIHGTRFPACDLATCIEVPKVLYAKGGGKASPEQMAAYLGYNGTNNGAYLSKIGAARLFGLIVKVGNDFVPTDIAHQIISPVYPQDAKTALVDSFMNIGLFKKIYDDFRGKQLPPDIGMQNALRNQYGVTANRAADAYKSLMDSADTAGFFESKSGARTHLISPVIQPRPLTGGSPMEEPPEVKANKEDNGIDDDNKHPPSASSIGSVKARYIETLLNLFDGKAAKGELDEKLMDRIERLLGEDKQGESI